VDYFNNTGQPLTELLLVVEPNRYPGSFQLKTLTWADTQPVTGYTIDGPKLILPLVAPLPPESRLELSISYDLNLPQQNAPYGYTDRQTNLGDWYTYIPPYTSGQGWIVREDAPFGEHLAYDISNFEVTIQLARPAATSGEPLVVAASALPRNQSAPFNYRLEAARNFAWTVSHLYQVQQTTLGEVTVTGYSFPYHPLADGPALQETTKALGVFSELFGPYPHDSLSVVEADFLDGMEYDGLIFLSHAFYDFYTGDQKSNLTIIAAHETAHQWWYGQVGNDQAREPWLDEALSTYSEVLFYEKAYPDLVSWWWDNRIDFHSPEGSVDSPIYDFSEFYPYRNAIYLRGAMFLGDLRQAMGDQAFFDFLRAYLALNSGRQATTQGFFELLSQSTTVDLSGLINTYFPNR
jgi:hypothetical protein